MTIYSLDVLLSNLEPVHCPMYSSNCCFLTCIQVSQEAGQVVWYSHLFQNFPQFLVIHTVKGFGIVNKAEIDVFLELSCFFDDPADVDNLIAGSSTFLKPAWTCGSSQFTSCWSLSGICVALELQAAKGKYPTSKVRSGGRGEILHIQSKEQWLRLLEQLWRDTPCPR